MYRLEAQETCKTGIHRILLERIDINIALLTEPTDDPDKAVHEARKNFKRLRAALRLVRDAIDPQVYHRENVCFRDASRQLAPLRDSAVLVETLDSIKEYYALAPDAFAAVREQLVANQMRQRQELLYTKNVPAAVAAILYAVRERIQQIEYSYDDFRIFAGGLERVYRRGRKCMAAAYVQPQDAHIFHDWRKRVKYLWHHIEILQIVQPLVMEEMGQELHEISNFLGDAHDLVVLKETIQAQSETAELVAMLDERRVEMETAVHPLGQRLYAETSKAFVNRIASYYASWQENNINGGLLHKSHK